MSLTQLPSVEINISGAIGRPLAGKDHITGLLIYDDPTDYPSGIMEKYVASQAYLKTSTTGAYVEDDSDQKVYTVINDYTADTNVSTDVAAGDLIEVTSASLIRAARIRKVYKSQLTTLGFIEGGISDDLWYMLDKYFKKNPNGFLWVGIYSIALATVTFVELNDMQLAAGGDLKKCGVYNNGNDTAFILAHLATIQALLVIERDTNKTPFSVDYCPLTYGEVHGSFLNLRSSGNNDHASIFNSFDQVQASAAKPALGTHLGYWAISKISESIGDRGQYNYTEGVDLETTSILDSSGLVKYEDLSTPQLTAIHVLGFTFLMKHNGFAGVYLNAHWTCVATTYTFIRVEMVTTIDKAARDVRTFCLPLLNKEVVFNKDGTLRQEAIDLYINAAERALDPMLAATEISAYSVDIDPTQKVQTTENMDIVIEVVQNGVSAKITVNLTSVESIS